MEPKLDPRKPGPSFINAMLIIIPLADQHEFAIQLGQDSTEF